MLVFRSRPPNLPVLRCVMLGRSCKEQKEEHKEEVHKEEDLSDQPTEEPNALAANPCCSCGETKVNRLMEKAKLSAGHASVLGVVKANRTVCTVCEEKADAEQSKQSAAWLDIVSVPRNLMAQPMDEDVDEQACSSQSTPSHNIAPTARAQMGASSQLGFLNPLHLLRGVEWFLRLLFGQEPN